MKRLVTAALVLAACGGEQAPVLPGDWDDASRQILAGAERTMGGAAVGLVDGLVTEADVAGPGDPFRTIIHSARDGRMRMEQTTGFRAGRDAAGWWLFDPRTGAADTLDAFGILFARGHELHMRALSPGTRFTGGRAQGEVVLDGERLLVVRATVTDGEEILLYFHAADTLPAGQRVLGTEPHVVVRFADWDTVAGLRLFRTATFDQGAERYVYTFTRLEPGALEDAAFNR